MIKYSNISNIDRSTINFLNLFEIQFIDEIKSILNKRDYEFLKVSYSISVVNPNISGKSFSVDSNASLSLENSIQLVSQIVDYLNRRDKELALFFDNKCQLSIKIHFEKKETNKFEESEEDKKDVMIYLPKEPRYSFDKVILPKEVTEEIFDALNIIKYQNLIYKEWGFEEIDPIPKSVLNFYGPPGTGKTMCAHAVAKELSLKILALNYAEIESKYVGDAAKNLTNAFETAKQNNCVIFFDEADSFLGKRIRNVTQGADQALNSLRSQMLILLEEFSGVVIFATNLVSNFDQAFESRILKHIQFPLPNEEARIAIIKKTLPQRLPIKDSFSEDQYKELSDILDGLSGREIKSAILECMLKKVSLEGCNSLFCFDDFKSAFEKKQESITALQEEKSKDKREKILKALENGRVKKEEGDDSVANRDNTLSGDSRIIGEEDVLEKKELDTKDEQLICLVSELGVFFGNCDGSYDDCEKSFVDNYLHSLSEKYSITRERLQNIKKSINVDESIDSLIEKTNSYAEQLNEHERISLKRTLSRFIYYLIRADGVLHPNEIFFYKAWKNGINIDDSIDIDS